MAQSITDFYDKVDDVGGLFLFWSTVYFLIDWLIGGERYSTAQVRDRIRQIF